MINFLNEKYLLVVLFFMPIIVFAAPRDFIGLVDLFMDIINTAVPIVIAFAVMGFFWGISKYILSAQDSTKIEEGRKVMIYGLVGLFVAVSIWGILGILEKTFL